jgi:hypothetical protein
MAYGLLNLILVIKMTEKSNLKLKSNLMVETVNGVEVKNAREQIHYFPGDFAAEIEPHRMKDTRMREIYFTHQQIIEYQQTIVCYTCKKPCAGTCSKSK